MAGSVAGGSDTTAIPTASPQRIPSQGLLPTLGFPTMGCQPPGVITRQGLLTPWGHFQPEVVNALIAPSGGWLPGQNPSPNVENMLKTWPRGGWVARWLGVAGWVAVWLGGWLGLLTSLADEISLLRSFTCAFGLPCARLFSFT